MVRLVKVSSVVSLEKEGGLEDEMELNGPNPK